MTEKSRQGGVSSDIASNDICHLPERHARQFCSIPDPGIVIDMEIQPGDPVDSQIIRNFMGEFEQARNKRTA
jgi:hypothetical protein